jgi:hypothetical protein
MIYLVPCRPILPLAFLQKLVEPKKRVVVCLAAGLIFNSDAMSGRNFGEFACLA